MLREYLFGHERRRTKLGADVVFYLAEFSEVILYYLVDSTSAYPLKIES